MSSRNASFNSFKSMIPFSSTERYVTSYPWLSKKAIGFKTASCSIAVVIMCRPSFLRRKAVCMMAVLSLSVPPLVKTISLSLFALIDSAITCLLSSSTRRASRPKLLTAEALPKTFFIISVMVSITSASIGVVPALSA